MGTKTIAFISQKGGTGKSTLALNIATLFAIAGKKTLLIDLDSQGSSTIWANLRQESDKKQAHIDTVKCPKQEFGNSFEAIKEQYQPDIVVIDTPPLSDMDIMTAIQASDIAIIPVVASLFDVVAISNSIKMCTLQNKIFFIAMNRYQTDNSSKEAEDFLENDNKTKGKVIGKIGNRTAVRRSTAQGLCILEADSDGKTIEEFKNFFENIVAKIGG